MPTALVCLASCAVILVSSIASAAPSHFLRVSNTLRTRDVDGFTYSGCYTEATNGRALTGNAFFSDLMTLDKCALACSAFTTFGVEYGRECFCGNGELNPGSISAPEIECSFDCPGNAAQKCGAGNRLNVFSKGNIGAPVPPPTGTSYTSKGCYSEPETGRALAGKSYYDDSMTLEKCATACSGFLYFGVEYGRECYCGNTIAYASLEANSADCKIACPGDISQACGGDWRLNLYTFGSTSPVVSSPAMSSSTSTALPTPSSIPRYTPDGCYTEADDQRALTGAHYFDDLMTVQKCERVCSGFTWFGVEYGRECYCGNIINSGSVKTESPQCNFPCPGDKSQLCGAGNRLNMYHFGQPASSTSSSHSETTTSSYSSTTTSSYSETPTSSYSSTTTFSHSESTTSSESTSSSQFTSSTAIFESSSSSEILLTTTPHSSTSSAESYTSSSATVPSTPSFETTSSSASASHSSTSSTEPTSSIPSSTTSSSTESTSAIPTSTTSSSAESTSVIPTSTTSSSTESSSAVSSTTSSTESSPVMPSSTGSSSAVLSTTPSTESSSIIPLTTSSFVPSSSASPSPSSTTSAAPQCTISGQLLQNPGFENQESGWAATASGSISWSTNGSNPRSGGRAARIRANSGGTSLTLRQQITVCAGKLHYMTAYAKQEANQGCTVQLVADGIVLATSTPGQSFTSLQQTFFPQTSTAQVAVKVSCGGSGSSQRTIYLDDVSVLQG